MIALAILTSIAVLVCGLLGFTSDSRDYTYVLGLGPVIAAPSEHSPSTTIPALPRPPRLNTAGHL